MNKNINSTNFCWFFLHFPNTINSRKTGHNTDVHLLIVLWICCLHSSIFHVDFVFCDIGYEHDHSNTFHLIITTRYSGAEQFMIRFWIAKKKMKFIHRAETIICPINLTLGVTSCSVSCFIFVFPANIFIIFQFYTYTSYRTQTCTFFFDELIEFLRVFLFLVFFFFIFLKFFSSLFNFSLYF